jgi:hypothetical protein
MTENKKENLNNRMIKFLFEGAPVRGACVQMAEEWQEMIKFHHYPENVAAFSDSSQPGLFFFRAPSSLRAA